MKLMNRSHVKLRSTSKRVNDLYARNPVKITTVNCEQNTNVKLSKRQKKSLIKPFPSSRLGINTLLNTRGNSAQVVTSRIDNSFLVNCTNNISAVPKKRMISSKCSKDNDHNIKKQGKLYLYESKLKELNKENEKLKEMINVKEAELRKKYETDLKQSKVLANIKDKIDKFSNRAISAINTLSINKVVYPQNLNANNESESIDSYSSTSSLITICNYEEAPDIKYKNPPKEDIYKNKHTHTKGKKLSEKVKENYSKSIKASCRNYKPKFTYLKK